MINFYAETNFWRRKLDNASIRLIFLSLILLLNGHGFIYARSESPFDTLKIDSAYVQALDVSWKNIEKSFYILDSSLSPETWQVFEGLDADLFFDTIDKNSIPLQLNKNSWVKARIKNELAVKLDLVISIKSSEAEIYIIGQDETERKFAGDFYPRSKWDSEKRFKSLSDPYIITFQLGPKESKEIIIKLGPYIKIKEATIRLASNEFAYRDLASWYSIRNLIQGFCIGMFSIMLLYNLLTFFASERDLTYLLNTFYILSLIGWFFTITGLDRLTFLAEYPSLTEYIRITSGYCIGVFYVMFSQAIIGKENIPAILNKLIKYLLYMVLIGIVLTNLLTWSFLTFNYFNILLARFIFPPIGLIGVLVSLLFIIHMFRLGTKRSNIIAISSCFVIFAASLAVFGDFLFLSGNASNQLKTANFSYSLIIEFAFIFQMLLFGFALGIRAKELEKEKVKLEELNSIKSQFFENISHEIRTPITLLLSPLKQVISELKDKTSAILLETSYKSGQRMLNLIDQILDISKIEAKSMSLNISLINIVDLFKECSSMFESQAAQRNIKLNFKSTSPEISIYADQDKLEKIAFNLISNAVKFNKENGSIEITIEERKDVVEISIKDQGIGIDTTDLKQIFNRFYQANTTQLKVGSSSGIGLALVKELVELHDGDITVESELDKGTNFILKLKKGNSHFKYEKIKGQKVEEKFITKQINQEIIPQNIAINASISTEAPIVLIIENHHGLHQYIKSLLSSYYQVISAYNGAKGIDMAIKVVPDLVISDVMMPEKDGLEVCDALKLDERTSHIPIILLTARADIEAKIKGLETGADDYVAKPFDHQELLVRIKNLLHQRAILRRKFKNDLHFDPKEISSNRSDKLFVQQILQVVKENISDQSFGVDELALEMAMSRTQLNRKLRNLLDQSTNKFIQSCRLNSAIELLKVPGNNVSQVAYATGFSSPAYFVKCFKEHFGSTPGKYFSQK